MKLKNWLNSAADQLEISSSPDLDAQLLAIHILGKDKAWLIANDDEEIDKKPLIELNQLLERRKTGEPIAYIVGHKEFYGYDFLVDKNVMIPRIESEAIVDYVLMNTPPNASVLDLGTGSGALAIALKRRRSDLQLTAADISSKALETANKNADLASVEIDFTQSDLLSSVEGKFDAIMANLPYVPTSKKSLEISFEPELALFAGNDGLEVYRKLIPQLSQHLKESGYCLLEHEPNQFSTLADIDSSFEVHQVSKFVTKLS